MIIYGIGIITLIWLAFFSYSHVYTSVISPKIIDQSEIIAKRQKVNIKLFNEITAELEAKKSLNPLIINGTTDPFSENETSLEPENEESINL